MNEVLMQWENIRVVKSEVGGEVIGCGRVARWWDNEFEARISYLWSGRFMG